MIYHILLYFRVQPKNSQEFVNGMFGIIAVIVQPYLNSKEGRTGMEKQGLTLGS